MRSILLAAGLALASLCHAQSFFPLPPGISGAWYNPAQPGHGLTVEILSPRSALVFWHVFDPDGNPVHLYIEGDVVGSEIRGRAYLGRGMRFGSFDPAEHSLQHWGSVRLRFDDCNAAHLRWLPTGPAGAGFIAGDMALSRLTAIAGLACGGAVPSAGLYGVSISGDGIRAGGSLLLGEDGSAWLSGPVAAYQSSFVFSGALGADGLLELQGTTEPAIALSAPEELNQLAQLDLSALAVVRGDAPGSYRATLPGGVAQVAISPLTIDSGARYAVYRRNFSLSELAGRYQALHGFLSGIHQEMDLATDGTFSGRDYGSNDGVAPPDCRYSGALALVPGTVAFIVELSAQGCGERDGDYRGRGSFTDVASSMGEGRVMHFAAIDFDAGGQPLSAFQFGGVSYDTPVQAQGE